VFNYIFIIWLSILPLVFFKSVFEGSKVFVFWIGCITLIIYWLTSIRKKIFQLINKWDLFYWLWISILVISSLRSDDPMNSIIGGVYRHQGAIFFIGLWLVGKTIKLLNKKQTKLLLRCLSTTLLIESLLIIVQKVSGIYLLNGRPMGTFGEPNAVAGFLSITPFISTNIPLNLIALIAILLTQSRAGLLAFTVIIIIKYFAKKTKIILATLAIVAVIFMGFLRPLNTGYKFEDRSVFNKLAITAIAKKPLIGYGPETTSKIFEAEFKNDGINLGNFMVDRSHNLVLDLLLWSGIFGTAFFLVWLFGNWNKFALGIIIFSFVQPFGVIHWILLFLMLHFNLQKNEQ